MRCGKNPDRSWARLLLSQPAGQRGARAPSDACLSEYVSAAQAWLSGLPCFAARLRIFRRGGAFGGAIFCGACGTWKNGPFSDARSAEDPRDIGNLGSLLICELAIMPSHKGTPLLLRIW